jgi:HK97 gp10 family phage protein
MANHVDGIQDVLRLLERVGRAPAKSLTAAVKAGAKIVQQDAKAHSPQDKGTLKKAIKLFAERRRVGKKVYQIAFDRKYNEIFQKTYQRSYRRNFRARGPSREVHAYYPASQEFGWKQYKGRKIPGKFFMKTAYSSNKSVVEETILDILKSELRRMGG